MTGVIYGIRDPMTPDIVRYVGQTVQSLKARLSQHIYYSFHRDKDTPKGIWIREILKEGRRPIIAPIHGGTVNIKYEHLGVVEAFYMAFYEYIYPCFVDGAQPLVNAAKAGGGSRPGWKHKPEALEKMRVASLGNTYGKLNKGKPVAPHTYETKMKLSRIQGGTDVIDSNGVIYKTMKDASRILNIPQGNISRVVSGERKTAGGLGFRRINISGR